MAVSCCSLIAVTVSPIQVALGKIGSGSNLVSASRGAWSCLWQILICILEIIDNLLHDLIMAALRACLNIGIAHTFGNERHLIPHLLQLVIEVCTQELHFCQQLSIGCFHLINGLNSTVAAGNGTVELIPQLIELTAVRLQRREDLHGVITRVVLTRATFQAVIGAHITVWPEVKRI